MKKIAMAVMAALLACGSTAYAGNANDPHYQEIKALKEKQRAEREERRKNPPPVDKNSFWHKEGERSGLSGAGSGISGFIKNMNPVPFLKNQQEKYNERKLAATK